MQKTLLLLACTLLLSLHLCAQSFTLSGTVQDENKKAIGVATVSILKAADSSWVRSELTDYSGRFSAKIAAGKYLLNIAAMNYVAAYQPVALDDNKAIDVVLQKKPNTLKEVTVTSKKPFIENDLGKTIVNVDASILSAGTNVLELLKKAPGVAVDPNSNILLQGKKGVLVLVDGRETYMSGADLADYLKTLSSDQVAQLELITQPSAKYDASGSAGIINIKLKKSNQNGFNGVATASYTQGFYNHSSENILMNYKHKKLNLLANLNHYDGVGWMRTYSSRTLIDPGTQTPNSTLFEHSEAKEVFAHTQLKLGADYNVNDKMSIGVSATGLYHPNHENTGGSTQLNDLANNTVIYSTATTPYHFLRESFLTTAYLKYDFSKQTNLTVDMNTMNFHKWAYQGADNKDYNPQGQLLDELYVQGDLPTAIQLYVLKADLSTVIKKDVKLEAGVKSSINDVDDNAGYTLLQNNAWVNDTTRSNHFIYKENINAAYVSARKSLNKKWEVMAGLRAEETNINTTQTIGNKVNNTSSISLFPTAFVGYKMNDKSQWEANIGRRIERPGYYSLNPFLDIVDKYNYGRGNPDLKPQFTTYAELKHIYKNELVTKLYANRHVKEISDVILTDTAAHAAIRTQGNVARSSSAGISITYNKQLFKWWQLSAGGGAYYSSYTDPNISKALVVGTGAYFNCDMQFTLGKGWSAEGEYYCSGRSISSAMTYDLANQGMEVGIAKKVLHDTANIKLTVSDPFNVNGFGQQFLGSDINGTYDFKWHSRSCGLTFTYNFGKKYDRKQTNIDITDDTKRVNM